MTSRRGFTLLEMSITLAVLLIASGLVVPALVDFGQTPARRTAGALIELLTTARHIAIDSNVTVTVVLDPETGRYRADSTGLLGSGPVSEGEVAFDGLEELVTESARLTWRFRPDGGALGDTVVVRGQEGSLVLSVDRWNGVARTDAQ
ncbi:MAG: GspH/FimT family pseudopilin [Gemmatimonadetes bacterium]|nr:GspH/FimT family pseudopilin [Gemmatimonadota bacterium]MBK9549649.1 GspH/FimT family pseudopilin [Gemmatimonadota bacterium]MBP7622289.1 GspH/FimT family pseudopilin [Gemmatimonadales bacterium]MBP9897855.1 GspH/FimT family pseudopilin [Gemmatimonadales bacterium]